MEKLRPKKFRQLVQNDPDNLWWSWTWNLPQVSHQSILLFMMPNARVNNLKNWNNKGW